MLACVLMPLSGLAQWSLDPLAQTTYTETGTPTVTVTINWTDGNDDGVQYVDIAYGGSAHPGSAFDYTPSVFANTLELDTAVSQSINITFDIIDDVLFENDETAVFQILSNPNFPATIDPDNSEVSFTIEDNDTAPTLELLIRPDCIDEGGDSATLIALLSEVTGKNTTVDLTDGLAGTALKDSDYTLSSDTLIIGANSRIGIDTISGLDDAEINEGDETVIFNVDDADIVNATASGGSQSATLTIEDKDDSQGFMVLSFPNRFVASTAVSASLAVDPADDTETYAIALPLPGGWTASSISDGGTDGRGVINWSGLSGDKTLTFDLVADGATSGTQALTATYTSGSGTFTDKGFILDIRGPVSVSPAALTVSEDFGTDTFTVVLTEVPIAPVAVGLSPSDPSEANINQSVHFFTSSNWDDPVTITVTGQPDNVADGDQNESVSVDPAQSFDPHFNGANGNDVAVTITNVAFVDLSENKGAGADNSVADPHPADANANGFISVYENQAYYIANAADPSKHLTIYNAIGIVENGGSYTVDGGLSEPEKWVKANQLGGGSYSESFNNRSFMNMATAPAPENGEVEFKISHQDKDGTYGLLRAEDGEYQILRSHDLTSWGFAGNARVSGSLGLYFDQDSSSSSHCYHKVVKVRE